MKRFKQFLEEKYLTRALKNIAHKWKNPRKFTPIENPITVYHGGPKKSNFNHQPDTSSADGAGHYMISSYEKASDYAEKSRGHVHNVEMHIHKRNMMDIDKTHSNQEPSIKKKLDKVFKKHGFKPNKHDFSMQDTIIKLGRHINSKNGKDGKHLDGHLEAADSFHEHGIHAGYGEYPKVGTSYCVYGKSRNQLEVKSSHKPIWHR